MTQGPALSLSPSLTLLAGQDLQPDLVVFLRPDVLLTDASEVDSAVFAKLCMPQVSERAQVGEAGLGVFLGTGADKLIGLRVFFFDAIDGRQLLQPTA